jgi:hypothetical protein
MELRDMKTKDLMKATNRSVFSIRRYRIKKHQPGEVVELLAKAFNMGVRDFIFLGEDDSDGNGNAKG